MTLIKHTPKTVIIFLTICVLCVTLITKPVGAVYDEQFYSSNDILFYDGGVGNSCDSFTPSTSYSVSSTENQNTVAKFLSSTNFIGNSNKPLNAVQMAAIMGNIQQESGFNPRAGVDNSASYRGISQWNAPGRWDAISDPKTDLNSQLNFIKTELDKNSYINNLSGFWGLSNSSSIDEATYLVARNYEVAILNGGGLPTWTNNSDATTNIQSWVNRKTYAHDMYNMYGNLAGSVCNGMDETQATAFMNTYENSNGEDLYQKTSCDGYSATDSNSSSKNILANCVAVVAYFLQNYTTFGSTIALPNGGQVVDTLIGSGFTPGGNTPKPYAIFSTDRYNTDTGHTGLVLGVEDDYIIVFEEGCGHKLNKDGDPWAGVHKYPMSEATSKYTYAYPPAGSLIKL